MEDEEDLEFLRLAALKSLNNKKEGDLTHISPPSTSHLINGNHLQPIGESARQLVNDYYANALPALPIERKPIVASAPHHLAAPYLHSTFEKIDLNDPYALPNGNLIGGIGFNKYQPAFGTKPSPNVQLSPRSAAFVLQNNDILMRRKGGRTPDSPPRSHSPIPYRRSPGRWSPTPPPLGKSRSPKRSPSYDYRRSISPPPNIRRTPPYTARNRSISRSPQRRRHSPFHATHIRRTKSRSPLPRNGPSNYRSQPRSRSPIPHSNGNSGNRRANSPPLRNVPRGWRAHSPTTSTKPNGIHNNKRSMSPRGNDEPPKNYRNQVRRRSRSPPINKTEVRRRSSSRSPGRKYQRNSTARRRRSPPRKFNQRTNNNNHNNRTTNTAPLRNRPTNPRRSPSPANKPVRRSKSKTPPTQQKVLPEKNTTAEKETPTQKESRPNKTEEKPPRDRKAAENEPKETKGKTEQEIEDELLASPHEANSDSESENDDDDGIDLFASEESESENEGRFKLSSRESENPTVAVSFSKLGTCTTAELRALEEIRDEKSGPTSRRNGRVNREKDRGRERGDSRNAYRREPNGRYSERKPETDTKNVGRDRLWKGSKSDSRRKTAVVDGSSEKERKPTMFKPTFQVIDSVARTKTPDAGKCMT